MQENSFSYKTLRNSFYLFLNFLLPMVFTIFVTRSSAIKLGDAEYGVLLLVNAISAFVNFVDLGLGVAVTKYAAEYRGRGDNLALEKLLSSSRQLFLFTGILGFLVFFILGKWFLPLFNIAPGSHSHIFQVFLLAGLVFLFNSLSTVYSALLSAMQSFDLLSKMSMVGLILTSLGTIILLEMGLRLKAIMALNAVMALFTLTMYNYYVRKQLPDLHINFQIDFFELKKAYSFGLLAFVSNLAASSLIYVDRLIIPIFLGPSQLPFYSVPGNVALKTSVVTNTFGQILFPMASELSGAGDTERLKAVYVRAFRNLHVISAAVSLSIALFARKILLFWLGEAYAEKGTSILVILSATYFIVALYVPLQGMLIGLGRIKYLIKQSLVMAVINLSLLLILVPHFGITGAAWAYFIAVLPMCAAFYWTERRLFNLTDQVQRYIKLYAKLLATAFFSGLLMYYLLVPLTKSIIHLVIIGPLSVLLYFVLFYLFGFMEKDDSDILKKFIIKFLRLSR
jgi:O-antigen/teichoic acid export membrane protein